MEQNKAIVINESTNQAIMSINEINEPLSEKGIFINFNESHESISKFNNLIGDSLKGIINTPNKHLEVIFKPDIADGLKSGTYKLLQTKEGEILADAIDSSKKIVGKGRIVETGKIKQLLSGGYQILSIAVAQSHLSDINTTLERIEQSCNEIKKQRENDKLSIIQSEYEYLSALFQELRTREDFTLSIERSIYIEDIIKHIFQYEAEIKNDFETLITDIDEQKDIDFIGTGDTYKALNKKISDVRNIINRKKTITELVILLQYIVSILDPYQKKYTPLKRYLDEQEKNWENLSAKFINNVNNKVEKLLKATFNDNVVIEVRKEKLITSAILYKVELESLTNHIKYAMLKLEYNLNKLTQLNGNLKYYLSFNDRGEIDKVGTGYIQNSIT